MVQQAAPVALPSPFAVEGWQWAKTFGQGLPVTAQQALAYGYDRVNGRVDRNAYMLPALLSRTLTLTAAGGPQQSTLQLGTALLVTSVSMRAYLTDAVNDDTTMLSAQVQLPNLQGNLIGDPGTFFNVALLAENATWLPLLTPWMLFPSDQTTFIATASSGLVGTATLALGLQGNWIYGMI